MRMQEITDQYPEDHPIWRYCSEYPNHGAEVVSIDGYKARKYYSGPYYSKGVYGHTGKTNKRYQNYFGPMVSGIPWVSQYKWAYLSELVI